MVANSNFNDTDITSQEYLIKLLIGDSEFSLVIETIVFSSACKF